MAFVYYDERGGWPSGALLLAYPRIWRDLMEDRIDAGGWPTRDAAASEEDDEALDTRLPLFVTVKSLSGRFVGFKDPEEGC